MDGKIALLLHYSWKSTGYRYEELTDAEKEILNREEFDKILISIGAKRVER